MGVINITANSTTDTSILWEWNAGLIGVNISVDGIGVCNFNNKDNSFILSGLNPKEYHEIYVYTASDSGMKTTQTTSTGTNGESLYYSLGLYFVFFLGLICIYIGLSESVVAFGAFVFGCIGIAGSLNNSFTMGTLFMILIVASLFVAFRGNN
jgi:hypothetical protein